jgi:hypothetical protein
VTRPSVVTVVFAYLAVSLAMLASDTVFVRRMGAPSFAVLGDAAPGAPAVTAFAPAEDAIGRAAAIELDAVLESQPTAKSAPRSQKASARAMG